jgi:muramidase (phage lysozyme)
VVELLKGRTHPLRLGWHIVRNPGQQQLSDSILDRDGLEQNFFCTVSPWNKVEKDKVAIEPLKARIRDILSDLVREEFAQVSTRLSNSAWAALIDA